MDRVELFNRFDLDNHHTVNDKIELVITYWPAAIGHWDHELSDVRNAADLQLDSHRVVVNAFRVAGAERLMDA